MRYIYFSLFASMFPMPRIVYAMASDGLIFRFLSYIMPTFKTPVLAALTTGLLAGMFDCLPFFDFFFSYSGIYFKAFLVLIFDLSQLIDMMSIGTLLAYSLVSASTLVLR
jgi:amino acid transporter